MKPPYARPTRVSAGASYKRPLLAPAILGPLHAMAPTRSGRHRLEEAAHFPPPGGLTLRSRSDLWFGSACGVFVRVCVQLQCVCGLWQCIFLHLSMQARSGSPVESHFVFSKYRLGQ